MQLFKAAKADIATDAIRTEDENNPNTILKSAKKNIRHGSILIFHDSKKAFPILSIILEPILEYCSQNNFQFKTL
jgi:hypothetical protein